MKLVRLLSLVVEETILLFKQNSPSKVIGLREVTIPQAVEKQPATLNQEDRKVALQIEINNLEQQKKSLKNESEQILFDLRENMNQEKEAWQLEKETERKQAEEKGYEVGFQKGEESALQQYEALLEEANRIVEKATEDYHRTIEKHEQTIVTLSIKAAQKILKREIEADETYVTSIIRKAMEDLNELTNISIYVSPIDYELVLQQKTEIEQSMQDEETLSIYIDPKLTKGDCIINHPFGQIDISLDLQLQQIKDALEEKLTENE